MYNTLKQTFCGCLTATMLCAASNVGAEPTVKFNYGTFNITEGVTDAVLELVKADMGKADPAKLKFDVKKINDEDLAKLCAAYPDMIGLSVDDDKTLTSIAPLASLKNLQELKLSAAKVTDPAPLAGLTKLTRLDVGMKAISGPDLKWMSGMTQLTSARIAVGGLVTSFEGLPSLPALKSIWISGASPADLTPLVKALPALQKLELYGCTIQDLTPLAQLASLDDLILYGSKVKDFSPLAGCPKLKKLMYYATSDADYATLGKLTQVQTLKGGLTKLDDIAWVADLPNLKEFHVFAEYIKDYSPLAKIKLENFTIWNMRAPVNLSPLAGIDSFTYFKLWNLKGVTGFDALASQVNLKELIIDEVNQKEGSVDMAFAKSLASLEKLTLSKSTVSNFDALAACTKLTSVTLRESTGINLAVIKQLPALTSLTVSKGTFSEAELEGFPAKVKITQW